MICPNINDPDYKNLSTKVGDTAAKVLWNKLGGDIRDYLAGKVTAERVNEGRYYTHSAISAFLLGIKDTEYREEDRLKIEQGIRDGLAHFSIDNPNRKYWHPFKREYVSFEGTPAGSEMDAMIRDITNELIDAQNNMNALAQWVKGGAHMEDISRLFGKKKWFKEDHFTSLKRLLDFNEGYDHIYTTDEFFKLKGIPASSFFGKNTLITEHNNGDFSLFEISGESFARQAGKSNELFRNFYEFSKDSRDKKEYNRLELEQNKVGLKQFTNTMLMAYIRHNMQDASFRRNGLIHVDRDGAASQMINSNASLRYLTYIAARPDIKEKMPLELQGLLENKDIHSVDAYGFDPLDTIMDMYKRMQGESEEYSYSRNILFKKLNGLNLTAFDKTEIISALKEYLVREQSSYTKEQLEKDPLYEYASEALRQYSSVKQIGFNSNHKKMGRVVDWLKTMTKIDSDVFQWGRAKVLAARQKLTGQLKVFLSERNVFSDKVINNYFNKRGLSSMKFSFMDRSGKIFEHMYKTVEAIDKDGNVVSRFANRIHWTLTDKDTRKLYDEGKLNADDIAFGKFIVDSIEKHYKQLLRHEALHGSSQFIDRDGKIREDKLSAYVDERYNATFRVHEKDSLVGTVPYLRKSVFQSITQDGTKGLGAAIEKFFSDAQNPNKVVDQMFDSDKDTAISEVADRFSWHFQKPDVLLKEMGYEYVDGQLHITDDRMTRDFSTDLNLISYLFASNAMRKQVYENDALPYMNAAIHILELFSKRNQDSYKEQARIAQLFVDRYIHGKTDVDKIGDVKLPFTTIPIDTMVNGVVKVTSSMGVAMSVPVGIVSLTGNMLKLFTNAIGNYSGFFGLADVTRAAGIVIRFFRNMASKDAQADYTKFVLLIDHLNLLIYDEQDLQNLPQHQKQNNNVWQNHWMHWMNWKTDVTARGIAIVAQMMNDGVWDAYSVVKDDADGYKLVYDVKKDKRFYNDNGTLKGGGMKEQIEERRRILIMDGMMAPETDGLPRAYTNQEVTRVKSITDEFVIGAYGKDVQPSVASKRLFRALFQFRWYLPAFIHNKLGRPQYIHDQGKFINVKGKDGSYEVRWENRAFEGELYSVAYALQELFTIRKEINTVEKWRQMPEHRRKNIVKLMTEVGTFLSLYVTYSLFVEAAGDDEDKDMGFIQETIFVKAFRNGIFDLVQLWTFDFYDELMKNPIPAWSTVRMLHEIFFRGKIENVPRLLPGGRTVKGIIDEYETLTEPL